jgi:hypothetical protein
MNIAPKKTVLVAWSGGLDSTRLICHYLDEGYAVDAVSVALLNNERKRLREKQAREQMMQTYFKDYPVRLIPGLEIYDPGNRPQSKVRGDALAMRELPGWMFAMVAALRAEHTEVAIGYVANDVVTATYRERILRLWASFGEFAFEQFPPLAFPLFQRDKYWAYETLPPVLRELVTWCNSVADVPSCALCDPCRKMISLGLRDDPSL